MPRIRPVGRDAADPAVEELVASVQQQMGAVPNFLATMANSPAVARAYLGFSQALSAGRLPPRLRVQVALAVSEANRCGYCVAAHAALGRGVGLSEQETRDARSARSSSEKERAALDFALRVVWARGAVSDQDLEQVHRAGYTDGEVCELVAHVALNVFSNYLNLVAQTEIDFPAVPMPAPAGPIANGRS